MKTHLLFSSVLLCLLMQETAAQQFNQTALLNQPCPDVYFSKVINNGGKGISIAQLKGKPLIVYFYSVHCMACLRTLPAIDSLQERFAGKINILLVGRESEEQVKQVLANRKTLKNLKLKMVVEDSVLRNIFKHTAVPHIVWIDDRGFVKAITGEIDAQSMTGWINGGSVAKQEKRDAVGKRSSDPSLYTDYQFTRSTEGILLYTYIAKAIPGTATVTGVHYNSEGQVERLNDVGSLRDLYRRLYAIPGLNSAAVVIEDTAIAKDNTRYRTDLIQKKGWTLNQCRAYFITCLDNYFGVQTSREIRKLRCWVLKHTANTVNFATGGGRYAREKEGENWLLTNHTWASVVHGMSDLQFRTPLQVIDETGIERRKAVDLVLPQNMTTLESVNRALQRYNLKMVEEEREVETVVLRPGKKE